MIVLQHGRAIMVKSAWLSLQLEQQQQQQQQQEQQVVIGVARHTILTAAAVLRDAAAPYSSQAAAGLILPQQPISSYHILLSAQQCNLRRYQSWQRQCVHHSFIHSPPHSASSIRTAPPCHCASATFDSDVMDKHLRLRHHHHCTDR